MDILMKLLKYLKVVKLHRSMPASGSSKYGQLRASGNDHGDLDALQLAAGQAVVHFPVDVLLRTQAHL